MSVRVLFGAGSMFLLASVAFGQVFTQAPNSRLDYQFTLVDTVPGGSSGFTVGKMNNRSDMIYSRFSEYDPETVFFVRRGVRTQLAAPGMQLAKDLVLAPSGTLSNIVLNDIGEAAFTFFTGDWAYPIGTNVGLFRMLQPSMSLTAVLNPNNTPAPGGGDFLGAGGFGISMNNLGEVAFGGIAPTDKGIHIDGEPDLGLGVGAYRADRAGRIVSIVVPGDAAPGGSWFDFARTPWINDAGDVAFVAHVAGEPCGSLGQPQSQFIGCLENLYVRDAATGATRLVAHLGDPAPGGGVFQYIFGPIINNRGDIAFAQSNLAPDGFVIDVGVYLYSNGTITAIARPGIPAPGGGNIVSTGPLVLGYDFNEHGEIVFDATLDTYAEQPDVPDTGLYVWSKGSLELVARTGTVIPAVGSIARITIPYITSFASSQPRMNARRDIVFQATLTDGRGVLLVASRN